MPQTERPQPSGEGVQRLAQTVFGTRDTLASLPAISLDRGLGERAYVESTLRSAIQGVARPVVVPLGADLGAKLEARREAQRGVDLIAFVTYVLTHDKQQVLRRVSGANHSAIDDLGSRYESILLAELDAGGVDSGLRRLRAWEEFPDVMSALEERTRAALYTARAPKPLHEAAVKLQPARSIEALIITLNAESLDQLSDELRMDLFSSQPTGRLDATAASASTIRRLAVLTPEDRFRAGQQRIAQILGEFFNTVSWRDARYYLEQGVQEEQVSNNGRLVRAWLAYEVRHA